MAEKERLREASTSGGRRSPVIRADGTRVGTNESVALESYSFGQATLVSSEVLRSLELLHQDLSALVAAHFSLKLRTDVSVEFKSLDLLEYREATAAFPDPTHLCSFRVDPLDGLGFVGMGASVALVAVNLILGGKGTVADAKRALTKIETDLAEEMVFGLLESWSGLWGGGGEYTPAIVGYESDATSLYLCDPEVPVLRLAMEVTIRESVGALHLSVPLHMIGAEVERMEARCKPAVTVAPSRSVAWSKKYDSVPLPAVVGVEVGRMSIGEFKALSPGDVVPFPDGAMDRTVLRLAGKPLLCGQFGVDGEQLALSIKDIL